MAKFKKGQSGNPGGRGKGVRDRYAKYRRMESRAEPIINKLLDLAEAGDLQAVRLVVDRIWPAQAETILALTERIEDLEEPLHRHPCLSAVRSI